MSKRNIIITCIIITVIIIGACIYYIVRAHNVGNVEENIIVNTEKRVEIKDDNIVTTSNSEKDKVSPNAILIMKQYYKGCGHTIDEKYDVPKDIVNMTEEEVEKYYSDWTVSSFSEEKIEIYKENSGICDEHYTVKDTNGYITIYSKGNSGEEKLIQTTEILTKYLPDEDKARLKNGVNIVGKQDLSSFLEDFE